LLSKTNLELVAGNLLAAFIKNHPKRYMNDNEIDAEKLKADYDLILQAFSDNSSEGLGVLPIAGGLDR